jgi:glycosyltransferase involved in cell wall biosynthesis
MRSQREGEELADCRITVLMLSSGERSSNRAVLLARELDAERFRVLMAITGAATALEDELRDSGVRMTGPGSRGKWDARSVLGLASLMRRERVDVLCTESAAGNIYGMFAATMAGTPARVAWARAPERGRLERRALRGASAVVAGSERTARALLAEGVGRERVNVIYDGVPEAALRTNLREREEVRSEHGVLEESWLIGVRAPLGGEVDLGCFLQAASIVRAEVPGTKFMLLGEGRERAELQRRATILGLDGSLILAGEQPKDAAYVAAMDVAVLPGETTHFGVQAMGLGRPIVAMDTGANAELFPMGEAGLVVPAGNPIILAHAVLEVMKRPDAVERMRKRGREIFAERHTMAVMVERYEELYTDLYERRQRGRVAAEGKPARSS